MGSSKSKIPTKTPESAGIPPSKQVQKTTGTNTAGASKTPFSAGMVRSDNLYESNRPTRATHQDVPREVMRRQSVPFKRDEEDGHFDDPLRLLAQKYKDIGSMIFNLKDNLIAHEKHESEVLSKLIRKMENENKVIVAFVNRLELSLSLAEKVNRDIKNKLNTINSSINRIAEENERYQNDEIDYPILRERLLGILQKHYPEMFPATNDQPRDTFAEDVKYYTKNLPIPIEDAHTPLKKRLKFDNNHIENEIVYADREEAAQELQATVQQHNKLVTDLDELNSKQEALQNEIHSAKSKIKDLHNVDSLLYSKSPLVDAELFSSRLQRNNSFFDSAKLRRDLDVSQDMQRSIRLQNERPSTIVTGNKDYGAKIRELEKKVFDMRKEAKDLDETYKNNLNRLYNREDEIYMMRSKNRSFNGRYGLDESRFVPSHPYADVSPRRNYY